MGDEADDLPVFKKCIGCPDKCNAENYQKSTTVTHVGSNTIQLGYSSSKYCVRDSNIECFTNTATRSFYQMNANV